MSGSLRAACQAISFQLAKNKPGSTLPDVSLVSKVAQRIGAADLPQAPYSASVGLNKTALELEKLLASGAALEKKQVRDAVWCLWETNPALAENAASLAKILEAVAMSPKRRPFRNLAAAYLVQYQSDRAGLSEVSQTLAPLALRWGEPWRGQQRIFALYDHLEGPRRIAEEAFRQNQSPTQTMLALGLGILNSQSGFAEAITRELLIKLANSADPDHEKRLARVRTYASKSDSELIFRTLDREIAEALMKPFLNKAPEKSTKDMFLSAIISIFRDPRIYPARWDAFPHIKKLVIAWLIEQSLRQFLDIVSRTMSSSSDSLMWKYRRAFWESAHKKRLIRGAWVVFSEDGTRLARRAFGNQSSFGVFNRNGSKQVQRNHAVLLLEIGNGIIADWSHNGKVNIWTDAEERGAPKLYRTSYSSDEVQIASGREDMNNAAHLIKSHHSPNSYNWQKVVASRIYEMTNTRMTEEDFRA